MKDDSGNTLLRHGSSQTDFDDVDVPNCSQTTYTGRLEGLSKELYIALQNERRQRLAITGLMLISNLAWVIVALLMLTQ